MFADWKVSHRAGSEVDIRSPAARGTSVDRELILHAGVTKTGSTSIQHALAANRAPLAAQGVFVPQTPGPIAHSLLPAACAEDPSLLPSFGLRIFQGLAPAARLAAFRTAFAAELAAMPSTVTRCILSSELISARLFLVSELERLHGMLAPHFSRIRVVIYLRRQDQHATSNYTQALRSGANALPSLRDAWASDDQQRDYAPMLDRLARVFGESAITPRIFAREDMPEGDVVADFAALAGIELPLRRIPEANQSASWEGQQLLRAGVGALAQGAAQGPAQGAAQGPALGADAAWRDSAVWAEFTSMISRALPGSGWRPTQEEARAFVERFRDSNEAVRARWFPNRASLFSEDFSGNTVSAMAEDAAATLNASISVLLNTAAYLKTREVTACMAQYRLYKRLQDKEGMRTMLTRALFNDPDHVVARAAMAAWHMQNNDPAQARSHAETALRLDPENAQAQRILRRATMPPRKVVPS